jgi:hypothetical protein
MALQIRRGTDAQRQATIFKSGELIYTTDLKDLWAGDNVTSGGTQIAPVKSVNGSTGTVVLTTDQITQGSTNKYYTSTQARIDSGAALVGGNSGNTGITFSYNSGSNTVTAIVSTGGYSLPNAAPTTLGGVKINAGGLQIDGAGLLSVITPVATGVAQQLSYYTGTNTVGPAGTGLRWNPTSIVSPGIGGDLTVGGVVDAKKINLTTDLTAGGLFIATNNDGGAANDTFSILSSHSSASEAVGMNLYRSRGTFSAQTTVQTGDALFAIRFIGSTGSNGAGIAAQIISKATGTVGSNIVPGLLTFSTANSSGTLVDSLTVAATKVSASVPFQVVSYADATARDAAITSPAAGMIVFLTGVSKFSGYSGAAWDNLN